MSQPPQTPRLRPIEENDEDVPQEHTEEQSRSNDRDENENQAQEEYDSQGDRSEGDAEQSPQPNGSRERSPTDDQRAEETRSPSPQIDLDEVNDPREGDPEFWQDMENHYLHGLGDPPYEKYARRNEDHDGDTDDEGGSRGRR